MEAREPTVVTYLDGTSTAAVSSLVADQFEGLFTRRGLIEWQLRRDLPLAAIEHVGTEGSTLRSMVVEAIRSESASGFGCWRLKASLGAAREEWIFSVADGLLPHLHVQLDRLNSSILADDERAIALACCGVVQRHLGEFCWDAKTFFGDRVSLYTYFKIQALQKRVASLAVQQPGWEHPRFVYRLRRTLESLRADRADFLRSLSWSEVLSNMKAIDALFSSGSNRKLLEDLLRPLAWGCEEWLSAV